VNTETLLERAKDKDINAWLVRVGGVGDDSSR